MPGLSWTLNRLARRYVEAEMNVKTTLAAVAGCAVLAVAGCSTSTPTTPGTSVPTSPAPTSPAPAGTQPAAANSITIQNFAFTALTVKPGATVTVTNKDSVDHTVTADSGNAFDVRVAAGGSATFTAPAKAGTYAYHCTIHPGMHGTLVVS
jgi:plastocyanin